MHCTPYSTEYKCTCPGSTYKYVQYSSGGRRCGLRVGLVSSTSTRAGPRSRSSGSLPHLVKGVGERAGLIRWGLFLGKGPWQPPVSNFWLSQSVWGSLWLSLDLGPPRAWRGLGLRQAKEHPPTSRPLCPAFGFHICPASPTLLAHARTQPLLNSSLCTFIFAQLTRLFRLVHASSSASASVSVSSWSFALITAAVAQRSIQSSE